ncbi:transposase [Mesorhizobium sp. M1403]|uniref:transposase n=1 Tax=Mesorhizobium sp. M1403 TaxID=2957097 RepID=UPI00333D97B9
MAARLASIRTPEGTPLPDNTRAELYRFLERLQLVREQIRAIEQVRLLVAAPAAAASGPHAMVRLLARIIGIGVETADMLVQEILSRGLRDRRAVARYAGLTGSPDESGKRRREKGLSRAGNARVRHSWPGAFSSSKRTVPRSNGSGRAISGRSRTRRSSCLRRCSLARSRSSMT